MCFKFQNDKPEGVGIKRENIELNADYDATMHVVHLYQSIIHSANKLA